MQYGGAIYVQESSVDIDNTQFSESTMGQVYGLQLTQLNLFQTVFIDNEELTAVTCSSCAIVHINSCKFSENSQSANGGALALITEVNQLLSFSIENCEFSFNSASNGGAIYAEDVSFNVKNCTFEGNSAITDFTEEFTEVIEGKGGGIYFFCSRCEVDIESSVFSKNLATYNGGAIAWEGVQPFYDNNTFAGNTAYYGPDQASFPVSCQELVTNSTRALSDLQLVPGQLGVLLQFGLHDHFDNLVTTQNSMKATLYAGTSISISGITRVTSVGGVLTFDDYILRGTPGSSGGLKLEVEGLADSLVELPVFFRHFAMGEVDLGDSCYVCEREFYSFVPSDSKCKDCLLNARCFGGYNLVPLSGYWRSSEYSETICECKSANVCKGGLPDKETGEYSYTGRCNEGYTSNLCHSCETGYSRSGTNTCGKCPEYWTNFLKLGGVAIFYLIILVVMVRSSIQSVHVRKELHSIYFKIFTNYLQLVSLISAFDLSWPQLVVDFFAVHQTAGSVSEQMLSLDCLIADHGYDKTEVYYTKLVSSALLPWLYFLLAVAFWGIYSLLKRNSRYMKEHLVCTCIILYFLVHASVIQTMFNSMDCLEIEDSEYWLMTDLDIKCWDATHVFYVLTVSVPSILVWGLITPTLCWIAIHRNRKRLDRLNVRMKYGFVYNGYYRSVYFWEFVILYRKIAIICCLVFLSHNIPVQALTVMLLMIVILYLQFRFEPFCIQDLNKMEVKSILISGLTIYSGLYFLTEKLTEGSKLCFFVVIIGGNLYFFFTWVSHTFRATLVFLGKKISWIHKRCVKGFKDGFDDSIFQLEEREDHIVGEGRDKLYSIVRSPSIHSSMFIQDKFQDLNDLFAMSIESNSAQYSQVEQSHPTVSHE